MDESVYFQLEQVVYTRPRSCERDLISAIIYQAYVDGAINFIDVKNKVFRTYCLLIDLNPEYVANKLRKAILIRSEN